MQSEWIRKPEGDTTVIFVHGILSDGNSCWRNPDGVYWPSLVKEEPHLQRVGIYVFTYETGFFSGSYSIRDIVDALKEHMRLDGVFDNRQLIFVCHSMGGIVVRKFIVDQAVGLIEATKDIGLFLIASPSLGATYASWLSPLARIVGHRQADALRFVRNNEWLNDLDREFMNLKENARLKIRGKELVEDKFVVLRRLWGRQVVEPFAGAKYFGDPYKVPLSDHFSIAKPKDRDAIQHRLLRRFILEMSGASHQIAETASVQTSSVPKKVATPKMRPRKRDASKYYISMTSVFAVNEQEIDSLLNKFGTEWPQVTVEWTQSYNDLISIIQDAVNRFDQEASQFSEDDFMKDAPPNLATGLSRREQVQERLPRLVRRTADFDRQYIKVAVKSFLLWGAFETHRHLIHIASWRGMKFLKLDIPAVVSSLGPCIYHSEESYRRIFREESEIYHGRLHYIGDYEIKRGGLPYVYLYAPKYILYKYGIEVNGPAEICTWFIPQIELEHEFDESNLPNEYKGRWKFSVIKSRHGEINE
jgi:Alpha/beta hydrolase family